MIQKLGLVLLVEACYNRDGHLEERYYATGKILFVIFIPYHFHVIPDILVAFPTHEPMSGWVRVRPLPKS